ncbi:carotenoid 1,2-hydratase [uncultured Alsobacter sp.]|uniref:carotenoid 1,2-hydratase n=1 Tax=uncultured Alsobacter sp. TaxID=1748258 RepID=UPI0025EA6279|nr:carotenoid 1,2-hydratase [uncultured Alsobacter sp.]
MSVNVAIYGRGVRRWTMTERGRQALSRNATALSIGPSSLRWTGDALTLDLDEVSAPLPRRVSGRIRLVPEGLASRVVTLDAAGRHQWMPIAPSARVEAEFRHPDLRFTGHGYFDTNGGSEPLSAGFASWTWSRAAIADGSAVLYDTVEASGARRSIAIAYDRTGQDRDFEPPPRVPLPGTLWQVPRETQCERGGTARIRRTLEDTPFYARSEIQTRLLGQDTVAVHESLAAGRVDTTIVRMMLPWRMPRRFI